MSSLRSSASWGTEHDRPGDIYAARPASLSSGAGQLHGRTVGGGHIELVAASAARRLCAMRAPPTNFGQRGCTTRVGKFLAAPFDLLGRPDQTFGLSASVQ